MHFGGLHSFFSKPYDIEAISLPIVYNKFGDHDPNGMLYVLKQDSERIQREARKRFELPVPQPYEEVQPLVIRANVGDTVQVTIYRSGKQGTLTLTVEEAKK